MLSIAFYTIRCIISNNLAVGHVENELAYLIQFRDQNHPSFIKCCNAHIWSELIFDFLVKKIQFEGFEPATSHPVINVLDATAVPDGAPEIVCMCCTYFIFWQLNVSYRLSQAIFRSFADITDMLDGISFCLKYPNGYKFEKTAVVKANFIALAIAFMEQNLKIN